MAEVRKIWHSKCFKPWMMRLAVGNSSAAKEWKPCHVDVMSCELFSFAEALAVHEDGIARRSQATGETLKDDCDDDFATRRDETYERD
jgi:hypothetical protein